MFSSTEPVVVFYKSLQCRHCTSVSDIWNTPANKNEDSIVTALKKVHPNIRTFIVTATDNSGVFNENEFPKDLIRYSRWFPMILLIPGPIWNEAMSKLGPNNNVQLLDGVQVMNAKWNNNTFDHSPQYDIHKSSEFARWLKEALNNENFKKVQNAIRQVQSLKPINTQPLLTPVRLPTPTTVPTVDNSRNPLMDFPPGDICSMKIIPRQR